MHVTAGTDYETLSRSLSRQQHHGELKTKPFHHHPRLPSRTSRLSLAIEAAPSSSSSLLPPPSSLLRDTLANHHEQRCLHNNSSSCVRADTDTPKMPSRLDAPVLTVDAGLIHKVDTRNVENLFSMWTVFSRCAGSLEEGRRLENLSWRLWNRETFCCDPVSEANATTPAISIASRSSEGRYSSTDVPSLSGSLDSIADEEAIDFESDHTSASTYAPLDMAHPQIRRHDSVGSRSRGRERHITPDDLEKMVITIKEKKDLEPLPLSSHSYLAPLAARRSQVEQMHSATPQITTSSAFDGSITSDDASDENSAMPASSDSASGASERSTTSVVRGFSLSPSHVSSSYRSHPLLSAPTSMPTQPDLTDAPAPKGPQPKKNSMFALGASSGSGTDSMSERTNSIESHVPSAPITQHKKLPVFNLGASSNEDESSLPRDLHSSFGKQSQVLTAKKTTSFLEEVATRTIEEEQPYDNDVFESDDEDDVDESAIDDDDDDSSDWEDSVEDSGNASVDDAFFKRVDSRPQLTSRRSLITTMLHQSDRAAALAQSAAAPPHRSTPPPVLQRSRTTSPSGPSLAASPDSDAEAPLMMVRAKPQMLKPIAEIPRSTAQPIIQPTNTMSHQLALSPRTTRRNMLASELTVSLRQHLLWERKQKSQTANAVLKRRHTAHDVANLKQYPEQAYMGKTDDRDATKSSWNDYYGTGLGEYHSRGW